MVYNMGYGCGRWRRIKNASVSYMEGAFNRKFTPFSHWKLVTGIVGVSCVGIIYPSRFKLSFYGFCRFFYYLCSSPSGTG